MDAAYFSERIVAAVDGAAAGNPGPGGWAWYIDSSRWSAGGAEMTTNNRMELTAVIEVLEATTGPITLVCDSRYVVDAATQWMAGWKRRGWRKHNGDPVANQDLFTRLDAVSHGRDIVYQWVRGHSGHPLNEEADVRARAAAESFRDRTNLDSGPGMFV